MKTKDYFNKINYYTIIYDERKHSSYWINIDIISYFL